MPKIKIYVYSFSQNDEKIVRFIYKLQLFNNMDLIDKKILCELDLDCRSSLSQIAKKLRVGRNVVDYRINKLEKERIIEQYISTIDLASLGYKTYRIYFKVQQSHDQEKFVEFLLKDYRVVHCLKTEGYFDYTLAVAIKSIGELDDFLMETRSKFKELIKDYHISILIYTKIFKLSKLLLDDKENIVKTRKISGEEHLVQIDEKDKKILKELSQHANKSVVELAEKTGLSIDVVIYRLRELKKRLIVSNRAILDLNKLGYYHYVIMLRTAQMTRADEAKLDAWCTKKNNIIYYGKRIGNFDFELNVAIQNIEDLNNFFLELKKGFGALIDSYELIINSKLLKLNYLPF